MLDFDLVMVVFTPYHYLVFLGRYIIVQDVYYAQLHIPTCCLIKMTLKDKVDWVMPIMWKAQKG